VKTRFSISTLVLSSLIFSGCGSGGTSVSEESFVAGDGVVTFVAKENRSFAPEIKGESLLGEKTSIEKGKITVINVWASWCSPCRAEAPALQAISEKYPVTQFIGILTRDSKDSALAFTRRFKITFPTIADDEILLGFRKSLPVTSIPTTIILDKNKKVAARISGAITIASLSNLIEKIDSESAK
jgi:thiol-disulfide isomerase/thioredoxin